MTKARKKVLITTGPTWVPIDDMRVISNRSSGQMGQLITKEMLKEGHHVTLLEGPVQNSFQDKSVTIHRFQFFDDLAKLMREELKKKYDAVIHAAAVSDYKIKSPSKTKIKSHHSSVQLNLIPTDKLVNLVKTINKDVLLVGFKLESSITKASIFKQTDSLFKNGKCDYVVANSIKGNVYKSYILSSSGNLSPMIQNKKDVAKTLSKIIKAGL